MEREGMEGEGMEGGEDGGWRNEEKGEVCMCEGGKDNMIKALHMPRPPLMYHEMLPAVLHQLLIVLALVSLHKTHCTD